MKRVLGLTATLLLAVGLFAGPVLAQEFYVSGLTVEKVVTGDAPDDAEFDFVLECDTDSYTQEFTLADGEAVTFEDVPQGATCTLTESAAADAEFGDDDFGTPEPTVESVDDPQASWDPDTRTLTFTMPDEPESESHISVTFVNDFGEEGVLGSGELVVTKRVSGDADGPWDFEVSCPGAVQDTVTLGDGESETFSITRQPEMTCTITELDADDFDVTHSIDGGDEAAGAEVSFVFDDGSVPAEVDLVREVEFHNEPKEDDTGVLADTGFDVAWGIVLAAGLLIPGTGALVYARRRDRRAA